MLVIRKIDWFQGPQKPIFEDGIDSLSHTPILSHVSHAGPAPLVANSRFASAIGSAGIAARDGTQEFQVRLTRFACSLYSGRFSSTSLQSAADFKRFSGERIVRRLGDMGCPAFARDAQRSAELACHAQTRSAARRGS